MYCSSCGVAVAQGLSYCKHCGAKLGGAGDDGVAKSSEVKPELLVSAMVGAFVLGLVAIAVLLGVMKQVAGLDLPFLLAAATVSFALMFVLEGVLIGLLFKGRRGAGGAGGDESPKGQTTRQLREAQARLFPDPVPSVTEHTTRTFDPVYVERESK